MDRRTFQRLELPRAGWHVLAVGVWGVAALAIHYQAVPLLHPDSARKAFVFAVWWGFATMVVWEALRRQFPALNRTPVLRLVLRSHERVREVTTATYFMLALLVCIKAFEMDTIAAAIFVTACADPAARIVGTAMGRHRWPRSKKSVEGSLGCFAVTAVIVLLVVGRPVSAVSAGALVAAAELVIPAFLPRFLDDNFWIPVACGLAVDWTPAIWKALGGG